MIQKLKGRNVMANKILCCGVLQEEMEYILKGKNNIEIEYMEAGLHTDLKKLESSITNSLNQQQSSLSVLLGFGTMCHPDMELIADKFGSRVVQAKNCIEMLLGEKLKELDAEARTFYITSGWLENWRKIFIEQLKWDPIDARQNFGFYERIMLLDTGIIPLDDEKILEFFEYTQVPIAIMPVELDYFRSLVFTQIINI